MNVKSVSHMIKIFLIIISLSSLNGKNILFVLFPGSSNDNIVLKNIFDSSTEMDPNIFYDIVLHQTDFNLWYRLYKKVLNKKYFNFHTYGSTPSVLNDQIDDIKSSKFVSFSQGLLKKWYKEFLSSDIINTLQKKNLNYDFIMTDIPNFISVLLRDIFNIKREMYLSMRPFPQHFMNYFEFNPSHFPVLGSNLGNEMTFNQRVRNYFQYQSNKLMDYFSRKEIKSIFNYYGYKNITSDCYFKNPIILIQYPIGITFPLSFPQNIKLLNALMIPKYLPEPKEENLPKIDENLLRIFKKSFKKLVLITKEVSSYESKSNLFNLLNQIEENYKGFYGFIILTTEDKFLEMDNCLNQIYPNNINEYHSFLSKILEEPKIRFIITRGNMNEIYTSIYNGIPVLTYGQGIYQKNINSYIRSNLLGVEVPRDAMNETIKFIRKIEEIDLDNYIGTRNIFREKAKDISKSLKYRTDPREDYFKWLNYGIKIGYNSLHVPIYDSPLRDIVLYGMDVVLIYILIIVLFFWIIFGLLRAMYTWLCCNTKNKKLREGNKKLKTD